MNWWILGIVGWLPCMVTGYLLLRLAFRTGFEEWSIGDRRLVILLSLTGPAAVLAGAIVAVTVFLQCSSDRPAKW